MEGGENSSYSSGASDADSYTASELSLSCSFSSFEEENSGATENSHEDTVIEPYSFGPIASAVGSPSHSEVEYESESPGLITQSGKPFT